MTDTTLVDVIKTHDALATRLVAAVQGLIARMNTNNGTIETVVVALENSHSQPQTPVSVPLPSQGAPTQPPA
jgi:hypothetical protein